MNIITQDILYKQGIVKYSLKFGVTKAAIKYKLHRKTIYRWLEKYDGTAKSLINKSRKPKSHPNEHTKEEIELIKKYKANNKDTGLIVLWVKLKKVGYKRRPESLYRVMRKLGIYKKAPSKRKQYTPKKYEEMTRPGERVQVDVKYVPKNCLTKELQEKGEKYYQYTAIDEYTRLRFIYFFKEHSTYSSTEFVRKLIKNIPFKIECIQTDNGFEFTNRFANTDKEKNTNTMFENELEKLGIKHKLIRPRTPRHNGKVERSHRKDQERFYYKRVFFSFEDLKNRARYWLNEYNNFPMKPLKWESPKEVLEKYLSA